MTIHIPLRHTSLVIGHDVAQPEVAERALAAFKTLARTWIEDDVKHIAERLPGHAEIHLSEIGFPAPQITEEGTRWTANATLTIGITD